MTEDATGEESMQVSSKKLQYTNLECTIIVTHQMSYQQMRKSCSFLRENGRDISMLTCRRNLIRNGVM